MRIFSFIFEMLSVGSQLERANQRVDLDAVERLIDVQCGDRTDILTSDEQGMVTAPSLPGRA